MKTDEIIKLFDRIKMHYTMFTYNDEKVKEWHKFLKDYDPNQVNERLDEYLQENHEQPPIMFALTRGLSKIQEEPEKVYLMKCEYCGHPMYVGNDMTDFLNHERECMKIDFIDRMSVKFRGQHIATAKYYEMSKEELDAAYHKIMNFYLQNKDVETNGFLKEMPSD